MSKKDAAGVVKTRKRLMTVRFAVSVSFSRCLKGRVRVIPIVFSGTCHDFVGTRTRPEVVYMVILGAYLLREANVRKYLVPFNGL